MTDPDTILDTRAAEIAKLDDDLIMDVAGVAQAADKIRQALNALDQLLDARAFERAAQLGYRDIASAFVFLQRTLGALQEAEHDRSAFVSKVAAEMGCAWEEAEPHVTARMASLRPRDGTECADRPAIVTPAGRVTVPRTALDALALAPDQGIRFFCGSDGRVEMVAEDHADVGLGRFGRGGAPFHVDAERSEGDGHRPGRCPKRIARKSRNRRCRVCISAPLSYPDPRVCASVSPVNAPP